MSPKDTVFAERLAQHRQNIAQLEANERSLSLQLARGSRRIDADTVARFGKAICEHLRGDNPALRKAYVRLLIDSVIVGNEVIHIQGSKCALETAIVRSGNADTTMVPSFDRKWCAYRTHIALYNPQKS